MTNPARLLFVLVPAIILIIFTRCGEVEPPAPENEEEIINCLTLTFTETAGGTPLIFRAFDADGEGPGAIEIDEIALEAETEYLLELTLENTLAGIDLTPEILEESDEHIFFFGWTAGLFDSPPGDGNIDNRQDPVNYADQDINGLPVGLITEWLTGDAESGTFQVLLKHQPDIKSSNSTAEDGATDLDITFNIIIG